MQKNKNLNIGRKRFREVEKNREITKVAKKDIWIKAENDFVKSP